MSTFKPLPDPKYVLVGLYDPNSSDFKVGDKVEDGLHYRRVWGKE